jgi:hypothetical protein
MPICAYCSKNVPRLTREHLFTKGLDELIIPPGETTHFFSERIPSKFVGAELTVKDVCASCNNTVLSQLDAHMIQWVKNHPVSHVAFGQSVSVSYDYDKMLRWLLKFGFNSARVHADFSGDSALLQRTRGYILGLSNRPRRIRLSAGVYHSFVPTTPKEIESFGTDPLYPFAFHTSVMKSVYRSQYKFTVRLVSLGAFGFLIVLFEPSAPDAEVTRLGDLVHSRFNYFRLLVPEQNSVRLEASGESTLACMEDHFRYQGILYGPKFDEFYSRHAKGTH